MKMAKTHTHTHTHTKLTSIKTDHHRHCRDHHFIANSICLFRLNQSRTPNSTSPKFNEKVYETNVAIVEMAFVHPLMDHFERDKRLQEI